jgi:hypothetical protein
MASISSTEWPASESDKDASTGSRSLTWDTGDSQAQRNSEMPMPPQHSFIDGENAPNAVRLNRVEPIYDCLASALSAIPALHFVECFPGRLSASNRLSNDENKAPVVEVGAHGVTGVELLVDSAIQIVQFYAITSTKTSCCRQMVQAIVSATPLDWLLAVPFHWSSGFWERIRTECPRIQVL